MVNLTYGILIPQPDGSYRLDALGTDIVSTINGTASVFDPGDIAWVLTCAALIIFMVRPPKPTSQCLTQFRFQVSVTSIPVLRAVKTRFSSYSYPWLRSPSSRSSGS